MFIKAIPKKDKSTGKTYHYHRLCESYRLGDKVRHHDWSHIVRIMNTQKVTTVILQDKNN